MTNSFQPVVIESNPQLEAYYRSTESRAGFRILLGNAQHFGYYPPGTLSPFPVDRALRAMEQRMYETLDLPPGSRVLDAGCGMGVVAVHMAKNGLDVDAIDYIHAHVEKTRKLVAREKLRNRIAVLMMDYHHLETLPDNLYDGVYSMESLAHANDLDAVLAGFLRVLKPGGKVVLHEHENLLLGNNLSRMGRKMVADVYRNSAMVNGYAARPDCYAKALEAAGFVDIEVRDYSENIRPMLRLFCSLAAVPWLFVEAFGVEKWFVNTIAGVAAYVGRRYWRYVSVSARKPEEVVQ